MSRFRSLLLACLTFAFVTGGALFKRSLAVAMCGLLSLNTGICGGLGNGSLVLAKPPIIRTEADTIYDFADDFAIAQQTPYSSGRNEILISSASTGAEQRFWTSLPGSGSFQLYELELTKIRAQSAESLIRRTNAPVSAAEIQSRFSRVEAKFDNNRLSSIVLADGSKAEFSDAQAILKNADGSVAATINAMQGGLGADALLATKSGQKLVKQLVAQAKSACESQTAVEIVQVSAQVQQWSKAIASQWEPNMDWQDGLTQGVILEASRALASSLKEATSGSVALQKTSCRQPVKCGQRRDTQAENIPGNQIITDLFQVPPGARGDLTLEYEFFQVPDRIEVSYNGEIQYAVGPTGGSDKKTFSLKEVEQGFVGIRVIGNPDSGTEWWYEISCKGEGQEGLDRWWTTAGNPNPMVVSWGVNLKQEGKYFLEVFTPGNEFGIASGSTIKIDDDKSVKFERLAGYTSLTELGKLEKGFHSIQMNGFAVPQQPTIQKVRMRLRGPEEKEISSFLLADRREVRNSNIDRYAEMYKPTLLFDAGEIGGNKKEGYPNSWNAKQEIWRGYQPEIRGSSDDALDLSSYPDRNSPARCGSNNVLYAVREEGNLIAVDYYFHYPRSNWEYYGGYNSHQGDWEGVTLFLSSSGQPLEVAFSQHLSTLLGFGSDGGIRVPWKLIDRSADGGFNVYVGLGGHASFPYPGITGWRGTPAKLVNLEFHKGDLDCISRTALERIPHVGSLDPAKDYPNYSWLLFPGKWGNDDGAPNGPVFLESSVADLDIGNDQGIGARWLSPWEWANKFKLIEQGTNDLTVVDQLIVVGKQDAPNSALAADEKRSILVGGSRSDRYVLEDGWGEEIDGSFIVPTR